MYVTVTGAGGHLGGTLIRQLLDNGAKIRAVDLVKGATLEGLDIEFMQGDVTDAAQMREAVDGVDAVCNLAAVISVIGDPTGIVQKVNIQGPATVASAALEAGVGRFVHASSIHAYDLAAAESPMDETGPRSVSDRIPIYDRTKWSGEQEVYQRIERGLDGVVVNPTGVIGPFDFAESRMGQVLLAIRDEKLPMLIDGGFDWVDVRDVAKGIIGALESGHTGENYLLSGTRYDVIAVAALAAAEVGVVPPTRTLPRWAAKAWGPFGTAIARRNESALSMTSESVRALFNGPEISSAKAARHFGYEARPIEETLADTYAWFEEQGV